MSLDNSFSMQAKRAVVTVALSGFLGFVLSEAGSAQVIDSEGIQGKVLAGYQGWYLAEGDAAEELGWRHWFDDDSVPGPDSYHGNMWPDVREYEDLYQAPGVTLLDGSDGMLFSSVMPQTVDLHFRWMRDHGIDGVLAQRFLIALRPRLNGDETPLHQARNTVLNNVVNAAEAHGRVFAIEYDVSNAQDHEAYSLITEDWLAIVSDGTSSHARYLTSGGRPVVAIWGFGFVSCDLSPSIANDILDFFRNDPRAGNPYLIGGIPRGWRSLSGDSLSDQAWGNIYRRFDVISPWMVNRFATPQEVLDFRDDWEADLAEASASNLEYLPVVFPGYNWSNNDFDKDPNAIPHRVVPRLDGLFLWTQVHQLADLGVTAIKVAMFDEVDEGTAIFKVSENHPVTGSWIHGDGFPEDWYLRLAGESGRMLRGEIELQGSVPGDSSWQCGNDEVRIDLGFADQNDGIQHPQMGDGTTMGVFRAGRNSRQTLGRFAYFQVDDEFAFAGSQSEVCVTVHYLDQGNGSLRLQYDAGVKAVYREAGQIQLKNSATWSYQTFYLEGVHFGNRQNGDADFRFEHMQGEAMVIDAVQVRGTRPLPTIAQVGAVQVTGNLKTVSFGRRFSDPVVIAQPPSFEGQQAAVARIEEVSGDGFVIRIQEPSNLDGAHVAETVHWLAVERGTWQLENGMRLEADSLSTSNTVTSNTQQWSSPSFASPFPSVPAVFTQVQGPTDLALIRTRQRNASSSGFQVALEEEEIAEPGHGFETIGWIAIESGVGDWSGRQFATGTTGAVVSDTWETVSLGVTSPNAHFLAALASRHGWDPAGLRHRNLEQGLVELKVEEDTTADGETWHIAEEVAYLVIDGNGLLKGMRYENP